MIFFNQSYFSGIDKDTGGTYLYDQGGLITTRAEADALFANMQKFFDAHGDEEIAAHNQQILNKMFGHESAPRQKAIKPPKPARAGWVYVVQIAGDNLYKIGMTYKTPDQRIAQFAPKMPYTAELVYTKQSANPMALEASLHQLYDDLRENGEWFRLSAADYASLIEYLDNLKE